MSVLDSLKDSTAAWLVLAGVTVFSLVFAVYTWFAGKRKREFTYLKSSYQIADVKESIVNNLTLLYNGKEVPDVSITRFFIWNCGQEEVRKEDLYKDHHLCILAKNDIAILDASIVSSSNPSQKLTAVSNQRSISIEFECIEPKNGFVLQIIHSGDDDGLIPFVQIKGGKSMCPYSANRINLYFSLAIGFLLSTYVFFTFMLIPTISPFAAFLFSLFYFIFTSFLIKKGIMGESLNRFLVPTFVFRQF